MPKATIARASNAYESKAVGAEPFVMTAQWESVTPAETEEPDAPTAEGAEGFEDEALSAMDVAAGYTDLSFAELRAEAKSRGLPSGGTAVELAARLDEHDRAAAADPAVELEA